MDNNTPELTVNPIMLEGIRTECLNILAVTNEASKVSFNSILPGKVKIPNVDVFVNSSKALTSLLGETVEGWTKFAEQATMDTMSRLREAAESGGFIPAYRTDQLSRESVGLNSDAPTVEDGLREATARQLALLATHVSVDGEKGYRTIREVSKSGFNASVLNSHGSEVSTYFPFLYIDLNKTRFFKPDNNRGRDLVEVQLNHPNTVLKAVVEPWAMDSQFCTPPAQVTLMLEIAKQASHVLLVQWKEMKEITSIEGTIIKAEDDGGVAHIDLSHVSPQNIKFMKTQHVEVTFTDTEVTINAPEIKAVLPPVAPEIAAIDILGKVVGTSHTRITTFQNDQKDYMIRLGNFHVEVSNALHGVFDTLGIGQIVKVVVPAQFAKHMTELALAKGIPTSVCDLLEELIITVHQMFPAKESGYTFSEFSSLVNKLSTATWYLRIAVLKTKEAEPAAA